MTYGVIMGQDSMSHLNIDTSITNQTISWGEKSIPMVPRNYWTKEKIRQLKHSTIRQSIDDTTNIKLAAKSKTSNATEEPKEPSIVVEATVEAAVEEPRVKVQVQSEYLKKIQEEVEVAKAELRKITSEIQVKAAQMKQQFSIEDPSPNISSTPDHESKGTLTLRFSSIDSSC